MKQGSVLVDPRANFLFEYPIAMQNPHSLIYFRVLMLRSPDFHLPKRPEDVSSTFQRDAEVVCELQTEGNRLYIRSFSVVTRSAIPSISS